MPFRELLKASWRPYMRLSHFLFVYRKRFILGLICGVLAGLMNGVVAMVVSFVGKKVFPEGATQQQMMEAAKSGVGPRIEEIVLICLLVPAFMLGRGLFSYLNAYCMTWVSLHVLRDLRRILFAHLVSQSLDFFNKSQSGKLISRVMNDTRMAQNSLVTIASDIVQQPVAIVTGAAVLLWLDWKFCLAAAVLFPVAIIPVVVFGRKVRQAGKMEENEAAAMTVILQESFAGIRVLKSFAREEYTVKQYDESSGKQLRVSLKVRRSMELSGPVVEFTAAMGVGLALMYVYFSQLPAATFVAIALGIFVLYAPVKSLSRIHLTMQKCLAAATNVFDLLEKKPSVQDAPDAVTLDKVEGRIEFRNVSFSYNETAPAVRDISLIIEPGKRYALVGASGAGKSTILSLLLRFYDPQQGAILLDGRDIRQIRQRSLRENIGVVTQDTFLFHDTIMENIRYGRLDATEEEIMEAARLAYAHDFIMKQPNGYQTVIGDKGCLISGGQQQRLAIARAILKNAPILLLDEATSALDSESERMIQNALERLSSGRTVIAIAHRLSTVLNSDQIIVMDHGRIVERGSHSELLDKSEVYRRLYELQFSHVGDNPAVASTT